MEAEVIAAVSELQENGGPTLLRPQWRWEGTGTFTGPERFGLLRYRSQRTPPSRGKDLSVPFMERYCARPMKIALCTLLLQNVARTEPKLSLVV